MKILQVHNEYFTGRGGEDTVLDQECTLLQNHGHRVDQLIVRTQTQDIEGLAGRARTAVYSIWSASGYRLVEDALSKFKPDVVHVHNTFPILSPSVYTAAHRARVPVIQTLHNYRLICANGLLMRDNSICEECVGRNSLPALTHRCYKNSLAGTLPLAAIRTFHRAAHTYGKNVTRFIALTNFAKEIFVKDGFLPDQIAVKPNFINDPLDGKAITTDRNRSVVYVGKLVAEKGVDLLIDAWTRLNTDATLRIIGDGPEAGRLKEMAAAQKNILFAGWLSRQELLTEIANARYLALPSRWYEGLPMVLIEALAVGTPAIVPRLGAMPEIIGDGDAGLIFAGGNARSLLTTLQLAVAEDPQWSEKSKAAREIYLRAFTPETNFDALMDIYTQAIRLTLES